MAQSYRSKFIQVMRGNEARMTELFKQLSAQIAATVNRYADSEGNVARARTFDIRQIVDGLVTNFFLGINQRGERAPFDTLPNGQVMPLSPYMRALWRGIVDAARIPVEQNADTLRRRLPPNVLMRMQHAQRNPFVSAKVRELFKPNVLAQYEPPHLWVDPNGYRLSDRVWNTADNTRRQLDAFLSDSIAKGRSALGMAGDLEAFLQPGRQLLTSRPYGVDASYDAMRLARTEIARAHAQATEMSAAMNPFVQGLKWNLSGSHPKPDICDDNAVGGPNGDGTYEIGSVPTCPAHPHCLCYLTQVMVEDSRRVLVQLHEDIKRTRAEFVDMVGPVAANQFLQMLLGQGLQVLAT